MRYFNAKVENGTIPLVLTPKYPTLFSFCMQVPSGMWVLKQRWNAHAGMMNPGLKIFWPAWNRISHIVTKQAVSFSNPVRFCPTSDNVMVDIDISISFQIGPTEEDAVKFVYTLGAHRFDELLYSLTVEAIRGLVQSVRHDQVHDLREEFALGMKKDLNTKLTEYGVFIHNVKVTNVELPPKLSSTLEETTAFKTRMEEQEKNHENRLRILLNEETQKLTALQKENDRAIQDLLAEKTRGSIRREEMRTNAEAKAQVAIAQQGAMSENKIREAEGLKEDAVATATAETVRRKALPMVELSNLQKDYERHVSVARIKADAIMKAAQREASKILASADAEANSAAFLVEKRNFDYQQKRIEVETRLAEVVPMVISGKNGDDLIRQTFLQTLDAKR
uniref:Band 7 domain-containing protein n=1 Tax=Globisporangium ultimum (strain ATCC 200006 / CBS 805.95 / DAOM BR144) TaxID=431595 RepID=K3X8U2_GLOUD